MMVYYSEKSIDSQGQVERNILDINYDWNLKFRYKKNNKGQRWNLKFRYKKKQQRTKL